MIMMNFSANIVNNMNANSNDNNNNNNNNNDNNNNNNLVSFGAQSFTSLKADLHQDINGGYVFNRCLNGS